MTTTPTHEPAVRAGWKGVIEEYRPFLPVSEKTPVVTMLEGGTPLIEARRLSERVGAKVWLKFEGKLSGSEAERMWRDLGQSLERCRSSVILDLQRCHWDGKSLSPEFRAKLAEYRDRVRVVLPKLQHAHPELLLLAKMFHEYKGGFGL